MSDEYYFANKYRIKSNRMEGFDYVSGWFFITICTNERKNHFGKIVHGKMIVNDIGNVANQCRINIPKHFPNVKIDEFIVMPNHIHGILVMDGICYKDCSNRLIKNMGDSIYYSKISPKRGMLGTVVRSYKSACTYIINKLHIGQFHRQPNYHDSIIRNKEGLEIIRMYIKNNPKNWDRDRNNK